MNKLLYVDSSLVSKTCQKHNPYYVLVKVVEHLNFGKTKIECYWFDLPCAYAPVSFIAYDIVDEKEIKELNFDNLINDINKGYGTRKFWYWQFLRLYYDYTSSWNSFDEVTISHKGMPIAKIDINNLDEWCRGQYVLKLSDTVLDDMIKHGIECTNCLKLKQLIRSDEVTMSTTEYLRMKGLIK